MRSWVNTFHQVLQWKKTGGCLFWHPKKKTNPKNHTDKQKKHQKNPKTKKTTQRLHTTSLPASVSPPKGCPPTPCPPSFPAKRCRGGSPAPPRRREGGFLRWSGRRRDRNSRLPPAPLPTDGRTDGHLDEVRVCASAACLRTRRRARFRGGGGTRGLLT